jgi:hypothetical protein
VQPEEIIRQRVDFLKIEYEQLREHNDHLENAEWKVRQLCITLWLATLGVGLGLQGVTSNNFYILVASLFIPYTFLFIDARIGRWIESHRVRRKQIDLFLSNKNYSLPSTGTSISFIEFCSDIDKSYLFPVLDFGGRATMGNSPEYVFYTKYTYPHMLIGLRRYFYQSQIIGSLIILAIQIYNMFSNPIIFLLPILGPFIYLIVSTYTRYRFRSAIKKTSSTDKATRANRIRKPTQLNALPRDENDLLSSFLQQPPNNPSIKY